MGKGEVTRQAILGHAVMLASRIGLEAMTIGRLADEMELSKSGLYAHFQSKEALLLQTLEYAGGRFIDVVVKPALGAPRGEPRVRAVFERWIEWPLVEPLSGCFFVAAATELDDRPGPVRDRLVSMQRDWLEVLSNTVRTAVREGDFREGVDPDQFAHDMYGVMLAYHHASRLLADPKAGARARRAFEALIVAARSPRAIADS